MKPNGNEPIRVCLAGAAGKMGVVMARALSLCDGIELVGAVDRDHVGEALKDFAGARHSDLVIEDKLGATLDACKPHVLLDFTHPGAAAAHAVSALNRNVAPVVGTSGLSQADLKEIAGASGQHGTPAMVIPNFAIGAVLMMKFAQMAARWMPDVEIVEMHHNAKLDAPSGTARRTAEMIGAVMPEAPKAGVREMVKVEGVRGGAVSNVRIHSVRLTGLVAHQQVLFGGPGEILTIRHDTMDRTCFIEGVKLAIREIWKQNGLVIGLDHLIE